MEGLEKNEGMRRNWEGKDRRARKAIEEGRAGIREGDGQGIRGKGGERVKNV